MAGKSIKRSKNGSIKKPGIKKSKSRSSNIKTHKIISKIK
jgi:hypothetical protein